MREWFYELGIGETRAALIEDGRILTARIEADDDGVRAGGIHEARLKAVVIPGRRAIVTLEGGQDALIEPVPAGVSEGGKLLVEVHRAALPEAGKDKLAIVRRAAAGAVVSPAPDLVMRLHESGERARPVASHGIDELEAAGWSELLEEARTGHADFAGGALRLSLTPAMTLIDIDGWLSPADLAVAGAAAAARLIWRHDIGGSIGIDLPTAGSKVARQAAADAFDASLPQPFERTAVNGFGFLQIVRRRSRASIPERIQGDPIGAATRALMRRAERTPGVGMRTVSAAPAVIRRIETRVDWQELLVRRIGAPIALRADASLAISAGHVDAQNP